MFILRDSREQNPLSFDGFKYVEAVERATLPVGDYSCRFKDGYQPKVSVERKSVEDLYGTLTKGHDRFNREIAKAAELGIWLIVAVERPISIVSKGIKHSNMEGDKLVDTCMTMFAKKVDIHFFESRSDMSYWCYKLFVAIGKLYITNNLKLRADKKRILEHL